MLWGRVSGVVGLESVVSNSLNVQSQMLLESVLFGIMCRVVRLELVMGAW